MLRLIADCEYRDHSFVSHEGGVSNVARRWLGRIRVSYARI